jgi:nucleoid-associated protein YgaU
MRKDVKVGLASGAVLLAVIIVYFSSLSKTPSTAQPGLSPTVAAGGSAGPAGHGTVTIEGETPVASANTGSSGTPGEADWTKLLGEGAPPSLMTHTPVGAPDSGDETEPAPSAGSTDVFASSTTGESASGAASAGTTAVVLTGPATPSRSSTPASAATNTYVVKENQSFSSIAKELYGSPHFYPHLMRANPGLDPLQLRPGMTIHVPDASAVKPTESPVASQATPEATPAVATGEYRVQSNDSLYRIAMKVYGSPKQVDEIYQLNKSTIGDDPARLKIGMVLKLPSKR